MKTPDELYQEGLTLRQSGDFAGAADKFKQVSENHASAMFFLAEMHEKKMFPGADPREALILYKRLEDYRPWAMLRLGMMYLRGREPNGNNPYETSWDWNPEEARRLIQKFEKYAVNDPDVDGSDWGNLGDAYCTGRLRRCDNPIMNTTKDDLETAVIYLKKAIDYWENASEKSDLDIAMENNCREQLNNTINRLRYV
jgi:tetratricopeptide (TPR) repeat protein